MSNTNVEGKNPDPTLHEFIPGIPERYTVHLEDIALTLMYLTGWIEDSTTQPGRKRFRTWKGYLFETLNRLAEDKCIIAFGNTKSVLLTEYGIERARAFMAKHLDLAPLNPESDRAKAIRYEAIEDIIKCAKKRDDASRKKRPA